MTEHRLPPSPVGSTNLYRWALDLVEYLTRNTERQESVQPTPIMLAHQIPSQLNRAIVPADRRRNSNGTLMYSVPATAPVYALNGAWQQVGTMTFRGAFVPGQQYFRGDVVLHGPHLAVANKEESVDPSPVDASPDWDLMAYLVPASDIAALQALIAALDARVTILEGGP